MSIRVDTELPRVVDGLPGLVWTALPDGSLELLNSRFRDYAGQGVNQSPDVAWQAALHPEDFLPWLDRWRSVAASAEPWDLELRLRRSDGAYRWFLCSASPELDATGQLARWYGVNIDIDARRRAETQLHSIETAFSRWVESFPGLVDIDEAKRAEDAIRTNERNLALTIDTIPALAWSANPDGTAEFFNQHYLDYIALSAHEAAGWGWTAAVHPADLNGLAATWQQILASGQLGEAEARLRRHDGTFRWFLFRASPLRDDAGTIVKWYGVNTDIEDRKRAEDALRRSESFLLQVQQVSHTGGWRYDVATDIVESSPEIQRFYGIQPGEDITRPSFWFERIHPDERPRVQALFEKCLREHTDYQADYRIVLPDGTIRYQYATGHPLLDDAGNLVEFIGASMDMTEHWRATNELQRASEELRELHTTISRATQAATVAELAASIAHEVNQPLFGIITNANVCVRRLDTDPPDVGHAREIASRIVRDGKRASDVVARLRALFSKKEFTLEPLDLNDATREIIALSLSDIRRHRVIVQSELDEGLPNVIGDRIQLQQVILNLLRNSLDAMAELRERPRLLLVKTEREPAEHVRLSVRDVGVGLDRGKLGKLFDAFYTTKSDGMGIGLSISRSIIERHHGRIWAVPNEVVGATFAFSIPHVQTHSVGGRPDDRPEPKNDPSVMSVS